MLSNLLADLFGLYIDATWLELCVWRELDAECSAGRRAGQRRYALAA